MPAPDADSAASLSLPRMPELDSPPQREQRRWFFQSPPKLLRGPLRAPFCLPCLCAMIADWLISQWHMSSGTRSVREPRWLIDLFDQRKEPEPLSLAIQFVGSRIGGQLTANVPAGHVPHNLTSHQIRVRLQPTTSCWATSMTLIDLFPHISRAGTCCV